ncbi:MAG: hypothetical protein AAGU21_14060 [Solidesulfovibrio sp.]|uniref:hypothetical protein n=1 Tax=Solidesulfovibrio sp. TaxID=2910990 RepID=UPI002B22098B|nr:hypothetical protein [Solidesulfovibrio sp.]MEA4856080.1 hypothetical protein [Solidesulfovibrio sp.]
MKQPATLPSLPPRVLARLLGAACLLSLVGGAVLAWDLATALTTGAFHLVRNPVTRESGGLFTAVAVMEALGLALCLVAGLVEAVLWRRLRQRR